MDYGPAPESAEHVLAWLKAHEAGFGHFINGRFTQAWPLCSTCSTRRTASASPASRKARRPTSTPRSPRRARRKANGRRCPATSARKHLYAIARHVQKRERFLAVLEALDNGKPIRETRDIDVPLVARHFYHHAGWASLVESELPGTKPVGVCGQIIPWNFPLLMLAWKIAPALAAGNTVVLKPAEYTPLTALAFAEICVEAGLPPGVVNIVTGDGETGAALVGACGRRQDRLHRLDRGRARDPQGDGGHAARSSRSNSAASRPSSCSTTPISTARSRAWSTRSGSTRARSAAPARACSSQKASPNRSTPNCAPAWASCASAIRSTRRSTSARSSRRCSSSASSGLVAEGAKEGLDLLARRRARAERAASIRRRWSPASSPLPS